MKQIVLVTLAIGTMTEKIRQQPVPGRSNPYLDEPELAF